MHGNLIFLRENLPLMSRLLQQYEIELAEKNQAVRLANAVADEYVAIDPSILPQSVQKIVLLMTNFDFDRYAFLQKAIKRLSYEIKLAETDDNDEWTIKVDSARNVHMIDTLRVLGLPEPKRGMIHCPLHNERTASCKVYEKHIHCFGCGAHEDSIGLVMKYRDYEFKDAVNFLV